MAKITAAKIDRELMDLKEVLEMPNVDVEMLRLAAEHALLRMVVVTSVFKRRFPEEHAKWEAED